MMLWNSKGCQPPQSINLLPKDHLPTQGWHITKTVGIAVTATKGNILYKNADFVNRNTSLARRQATSKKSAALSSSRRGPGKILGKLTIYPLRIPLRVMSGRPQKNNLCTTFGAVVSMIVTLRLNISPISMELDLVQEFLLQANKHTNSCGEKISDHHCSCHLFI